MFLTILPFLVFAAFILSLSIQVTKRHAIWPALSIFGELLTLAVLGVLGAAGSFSWILLATAILVALFTALSLTEPDTSSLSTAELEERAGQAHYQMEVWAWSMAPKSTEKYARAYKIWTEAMDQIKILEANGS